MLSAREIHLQMHALISFGPEKHVCAELIASSFHEAQALLKPLARPAEA